MTSPAPSQYIKGFVEFYKLKFKVTPDVLIPRPETELLVDEVLKFVDVIASPAKQSLTILDLGTGAGNIAISIAKNLASQTASQTTSGNVKIIATDISGKALKIASQNAKFHGVQAKVEFIHSNLLESIQLGVRSYNELNKIDVIVTNLPYIPSERIPYLDSSVKDFEPHVALDGGQDGFQLYRKLFAQLKDKKIKFDLLVGEIDYTHGELAILEAQKYFPDMEAEVKLDLHHKQRILKITF